MKLRTALLDGNTELATIDDIGGITLGTPVFPTGNAGEVVFVDGSNHAATSANLTFDVGAKALVLDVDGQIQNNDGPSVALNFAASELILFVDASTYSFAADRFTPTSGTVNLGTNGPQTWANAYIATSLDVGGGSVVLDSTGLTTGSGLFFTSVTSPLVITDPVAVGDLPSAATSGAGARASVNDALLPAFGATVANGGGVTVPVYSDGTNWKVG